MAKRLDTSKAHSMHYFQDMHHPGKIHFQKVTFYLFFTFLIFVQQTFVVVKLVHFVIMTWKLYLWALCTGREFPFFKLCNFIYKLSANRWKTNDDLNLKIKEPWNEHTPYLFSSSDMSACSFKCHFSAWLNTCLRRRTLVCAALMSSDSTSPLTTAQRPSNMSVTSSRVYVSSTSLCKQSFYGINPFFRSGLIIG